MTEKWVVDPQQSFFVVDDEDNLIAICLDPDDAKLMSAAPRMMESLQAARAILLEMDTPQSRTALESITRILADINSWH